MPRDPDDAAVWLESATEERRVVGILLNLSPPLISIACFHAQQCVEKSLKAVIIDRRLEFPYTHDIGHLLDLLGGHGPKNVAENVLVAMTSFAVALRYPGGSDPPEPSELQAIIAATDAVLAWAQREVDG